MGKGEMVDLDYVLMKRANEMTQSVEQVRLRRHERERDPWAVRVPRQERRQQRRGRERKP